MAMETTWQEVSNHSVEEILSFPLREKIFCGAIRLVRSDWLMNFEETRLPRCQVLPKEAFMRVDELEDDLSNVIALSYMWLHPDHPDPDGWTLSLVQRALRIHCCNKAGEVESQYGIFWDYASLYQKPRTAKEDELFQSGLNAIANLFLHPDVAVFQVTEIPDEFTPVEHNAMPYLERGWPYAENCWSSLIKTGLLANVYNLSLLGEDATTPNVMYSRCVRKSRKSPLPPEEFCEKADSLSFSNGKDDRPLVKKLYKDAFVRLFSNIRSLDYSTLGWNDPDSRSSESQNLIHVICRGYAPHLKQLDLNENELGPLFCESFLPVMQHIQLLELNLSQNPLGDRGVGLLAEILTQIRSICLSCVGLTDVGCQNLMELLSRQSMEDTKLVKLDLSGNSIGGETGVGALAPFLSTIRRVDLMNVNMTDTGCQALADNLPLKDDVRWQYISLSVNGIESIEPIEAIRRQSPLLREIDVQANPVARHYGPCFQSIEL